MTNATTQRIASGVSTWRIDPAHSEIGFEVKHMMFATVRGRFRAVEGTFELVQGELDQSHVTAVVESASIDTGHAQRDEHLRSPDFFDVERYPTLSFESRSVRRGARGTLNVTGELTIRGVTRSVILEVSESGRGVDPWGNERIGFTATTTIDRRHFGLTWNQALETGGILVGNAVRITLEIQAVEANESEET